MNPDPLIEALCSQASLTSSQAEGVAGVLLNKLKEKLPASEFCHFLAAFPHAEDWMQSAPTLPPLKTGGFRLPGMEKLQLLTQMNQALQALNIPSSQAASLGRILKASIREHHPHLEDVVQHLL